MTSRRRAALAGLGLLLPCACGVEPQPNPEPIPGDRLPKVTETPNVTLPQNRVRVWGVREGRLIPLFVNATSRDVAGRVEALLGLNSAGRELPTALPAGARLLGSVERGDAVDLELDPTLRTLPEADVELVLAQLVFTVTELPQILRVRVRVEGAPLMPVDADGLPIARALSRTDFAALATGP